MNIITRYKIYLASTGKYLLASLIPLVFSVLINPLMAKNLSPEDYATIAYFTSFGSLFSPIIGFFIIDYYLRCYYQSTKEELIKLKGTALKLLLYMSSLIGALCLGGLYVYMTAARVSFNFSPYAVYSLAQVYLSLFYAFQLAEYKIAGKSSEYLKVSVLWGFVVVLLNFFLVIIIKGGASGKLLAALLGSLLPFVVYITNNRRFFKVKFDVKIVKSFLIFGAPLVLAGMLEFFSNGYDKVLLEKGGDTISLGYYAVACQMSGYLNIFSTALKSTFQPDMFKAIAEKNIRRCTLIILPIIGIIGSIVLVYIVLCPWVISLLTAGRYVAAIPLSRITALSVITFSFYSLISLFTYGVGLSKITLYNKIIGTALNIVLLTLLIRTYGVFGAAWGLVLVYVIYAIGNLCFLYYYRKRFM